MAGAASPRSYQGCKARCLARTKSHGEANHAAPLGSVAVYSIADGSCSRSLSDRSLMSETRPSAPPTAREPGVLRPRRRPQGDEPVGRGARPPAATRRDRCLGGARGHRGRGGPATRPGRCSCVRSRIHGSTNARARRSRPSSRGSRRSSPTAGRASTLALAAPALGGFIYPVAADQAIARDANEQREMLAAGSEIDPATIPDRRAEAVLLRGRIVVPTSGGIDNAGSPEEIGRTGEFRS